MKKSLKIKRFFIVNCNGNFTFNFSSFPRRFFGFFFLAQWKGGARAIKEAYMMIPGGQI